MLIIQLRAQAIYVLEHKKHNIPLSSCGKEGLSIDSLAEYRGSYAHQGTAVA